MPGKTFSPPRPRRGGGGDINGYDGICTGAKGVRGMPGVVGVDPRLGVPSDRMGGFGAFAQPPAELPEIKLLAVARAAAEPPPIAPAAAPRAGAQPTVGP